MEKKALEAGIAEAGLETLKLIPIVGSVVEGMRKYHETLEDEQRTRFVLRLQGRVSSLERNSERYRTEAGQDYLRKTVATCLNAEQTDKLDYLVNSLCNGPTVEGGDALRLKLLEIVRQASRPALDVLAASLGNQLATGEVIPRYLAKDMGWDPALVDSCVKELAALGAYSEATAWSSTGGVASGFSKGTPGISPISKALGELIEEPGA